jgi:ABC-2 type transport system ATP-binding protein
VLPGIDLVVAPGEQVGLLGPNGAGKSTLLRLAAGLAGPDAGVVELHGRAATDPSARIGVGYLAELFRFPSWQTVDETLRLHQRLAGSAAGVPERMELLELVGLAERRDARVGTLSKGQQQRLGLAQALVGEPTLVLLDEPTSALDPVGVRMVRRLLTTLRERGVAVLLSSHQLHEVELSCDRIALLRDGRVLHEGPVPELLRRSGHADLESLYVAAMRDASGAPG